MSETCGNCETRTHAERAECTRIHPLPRPPRTYRLRRDRHDVAAVPDVDRVVREDLVEPICDPIRVNRRAVGLEQRHELPASGRFGIREFLHPLLAGLAFVLFEAAG